MSNTIVSPKLIRLSSRDIPAQESFKASVFLRHSTTSFMPDHSPKIFANPSKNTGHFLPRSSTMSLESKKNNALSLNAEKLKCKLNEIQKLSSNEGRKEYIRNQIEEKIKNRIQEKMSTLIRKKQGKKTKIYDQFNVLEIMNKKNKRSKLNNQNNESKFNAKLDAFKKVNTFIDLKEVIKKMNIMEDEDFKEFLEHAKLTKDSLFDRFKDFENEDSGTKLKKEPEEENLDFVLKPKHQNLLRRIHQKLSNTKSDSNKNMKISLSKQLMGTLRKEEHSSFQDDFFYEKMNDYISNENLMLMQTENNSIEGGSNQATFTEHKKNVEASKLYENFKAYKEIQEIKNLLKKLGITFNSLNNDGDLLETSSYSINYTQKVDHFRKTLKNASLDVLRKNMEEFKENKSHVGIRRNALALTGLQTNGSKYKKLAMMRNASKTDSSMDSNIFRSFTNTSIKQKKNDPFITQTSQNSDDDVLKKIIELDQKKEKKKLAKLMEVPSTLESPKLEREFKDSFTFKKYDAYLDFINRNTLNNAYVRKNKLLSKEVRRNLSKTFEWFVSDVKDLEKHYEEDKKKRNDRLKTFNQQMKEIHNKFQSETSFANMNIFEPAKVDNRANISPKLMQPKRKAYFSNK